MRKVILPALTFLLCQSSLIATPAWSQDSASAEPQATKQGAKGKKVKQTKTEDAVVDSTSSSSAAKPADDDAEVTKPSNREMNELDKFLGTPVTPSTSSSSSYSPPDSSTAPSTGDMQSTPSTNDTQTTPSTSSNDGSTSNDSSSDSSAASSSSGGPREAADDDDNKLPDNRLKAGEMNNDAITAMNAKQFEKAISLLSQAVRIDPTYEQGKSNLRVAYFNYGVSLYNAGKYTEALPWIQKAVALSKQLHRDDPEMQSLLNDCQQAVKETHH